MAVLAARDVPLLEVAVVVDALTVVFVVTVEVVVLLLVMILAGGGLGIRSGRAVPAFNEGDLRRLSPTGAGPFAAASAAALLARTTFSFPIGT
jgi:hypothetical protein